MKSFLFGSVLALAACGSNESTDSKVTIVGGKNVSPLQTDATRVSTVALTTDFVRPGSTDSPLSKGSSFCTATIIRKNVLLTAAHCVQEFDPATKKKSDKLSLPNSRDFIAFFGLKVATGGKLVRALKVIPHPAWDPNLTVAPIKRSPPNDIGLIILSEDVPAGYAPAEIASPRLDLSTSRMILAGFGVTKSRNTNDTGTLRVVETAFQSANDKSFIVSVGETGRGACAGDSGGPAYVKVNGKLQLVGATSTGAEIFGRCLGLLNNYTDARFYGSWIDSTLAQNGIR